MKTAAQLVSEIEARVRPTICPTFGSKGESIEGRISQADFDAIVRLFRDADRRARAEERERCASLHESVDPASDDERHNNVPGAGAMGAVIEYRDLIRSRT